MPAISNKPTLWLHNVTDNQPILKTNTQGIHSVASLVKIMAAMVIIDTNVDLTEQVELDTELILHPRDLTRWPLSMRPSKIVNGQDQLIDHIEQNTIPFVLTKNIYTKDELLQAMLIPSDNYATETLVKTHPLGPKKFIDLMNEKAQQLGMTDTIFVNAHGCIPGPTRPDNFSTAADMHLMIIESLKYDLIKKYSVVNSTFVNGIDLKNINRHIMLNFENSIDGFLLSKTGFSEASGFHVAMAFEHNSKLYDIILLGMPGWDIRYSTLNKLIARTIQ
jgi:D-alanyl-D-alanine carboxypeptidase